MKLSFAAVLLGQTIPALSKQPDHDGPLVARRSNGALRLTTGSEIREATSPQSLNLGQDDERRGLRRKRRRGMRQVARNLKNNPSALKAAVVPCDPRSTDADVGILSCGNDQICKPSITSSLGGVCTPVEANRFDQELARGSILSSKGPLVNRGTNLVECDPASIDIGILSCGEGQICKHDETSGLGGFCFDTATSDNRRLQSSYPLEYFLYSCEPFPDDYYLSFSCDCSGLDVETGAGDIKCSQNTTADYVQGCDEYVVSNFWTYSFNDSALVKLEDCYETTSPFNESICFTYDSFDEKDLACYTEWNGQRCTSCDITGNLVPAFNCSNVEGGRVGDSINEILSVFDLCSNSTCNDLCGEGYVFGSNDAGTFSFYYCEYFAYFEENAVLSDASCPYYMEAAQLSGCCVPLNSTSSGGNNATIPEEDDDEETNGSSREPAPARLLRASQPRPGKAML